ncbi:outer membrane beta-barrel protein [Lysobacter sp. HDW10]|jgi:OOP family OmpA-OmpF porin|uniref:OmpA family protein n=1 Tax=Lysobacter sp. HDW10 TaxID=2714936 RepID=UPI00140B9251|nr:outer membrane beta-barrel protein [Lysobacter sp. HDW10]
MNKKLLCAALLCGMGVAQAASAQEFDDRWYVSGSTGVNFQDSDRGTEDALFGTLGFGKFWTPNWSVDLEANYQNPDKTSNPNLWWTQYGLSVDARYHFRNADSKWWPYVKFGLGMQRHEEEFAATCGPAAGIPMQADCPAQHEDNNAAANLGVGLQFDFGRVDLRTELGARVDFDKEQGRRPQDQQSQFTDLLASVGLTVALGPDRAAPVVEAPVVDNCADKDGDGDGVNDCNDKCPDSTAGQAVGPDGCAVPLTIDLKGVNFDFDKSKLRPDAIAILNEGIEILKRYPDLRVEVAGHTDLCGADTYNQALSERRARAVYDYMASNGIDAGRMAGPVGYGESRPLVSTAQTKPDCKNETNRRTELNVQN